MNDVFAFPMLTAREQERFRAELLWELRGVIAKYNRGSGSSVRAEQAESLLESMLFCVSVYLQNVPDAAAEVRGISGAELYRRGLAAVKEVLQECRAIYRGVLETRIPTELAVYNGTLDLGIPAVLNAYDPEFAAHEVSAPGLAFDYPLQKQISGGGILYIRDYLVQMKRENESCAVYRKNYIRSVLLLYGKKYGMDYRELVVNIPEVLASAHKKSGAEAPPERAENDGISS